MSQIMDLTPLRARLQDDALVATIGQYLSYEQNEIAKAEVKQLIKRVTDQDRGADEVLRSLFRSRLTFGTAGIRGRMGPGYGQMSDLLIVQTSQGIASYLKDTFLSSLNKPPNKVVAIGYDGRYNSRRWAGLAGRAMSSVGFTAKIFPAFVPTPMIPFSVRALKAVAGIMITASHNPKHDNGYKVYLANGAQLNSPHDSGIQTCIEANLEPWPKSYKAVAEDSSIKDLEHQYLEYITSSSSSGEEQRALNKDLKLVFTSLHGVGGKLMSAALHQAGFRQAAPVTSQYEPDPEFPTVVFPNPEEGQGVLDESYAAADRHGANLILANDPDADRIAVAERLTSSGAWKVFSGNEMGILLAVELWTRFRSTHPKVPPSAVHAISSTVSTHFLDTMVAKEGFHYHETLTGFKWMGNLAHQILTSGRDQHVLFAFEEAIGYMVGGSAADLDSGRLVLDKDGIYTGLIIANMAARLHSSGKSLQSQLASIADQYGTHVSYNSYYICTDQLIIKQIFNRLAHFQANDQLDHQTSEGQAQDGGGNVYTYPQSFCSLARVRRVRDLNLGYDSQHPHPNLPVSQSSFMVTFYLDLVGGHQEEAWLTIRTSGTEPKIKFYSEATSSTSPAGQLEAKLHQVVDTALQVCLQPDLHGLRKKAD